METEVTDFVSFEFYLLNKLLKTNFFNKLALSLSLLLHILRDKISFKRRLVNFRRCYSLVFSFQLLFLHDSDRLLIRRSTFAVEFRTVGELPRCVGTVLWSDELLEQLNSVRNCEKSPLIKEIFKLTRCI